jgi:hypothetical protein
MTRKKPPARSARSRLSKTVMIRGRKHWRSVADMDAAQRRQTESEFLASIHPTHYDENRASDDGMPHHDAGVPSDANQVLHGPFDDLPGDPSPEMTKEEAHPFYKGVGLHDDGSVMKSRSDAVADMKAQRAILKGQMNQQSPYTSQTAEASKMRECLSECAKVVAEAIVLGAKIIAGKDDKPSVNPLPPEFSDPLSIGIPCIDYIKNGPLEVDYLGAGYSIILMDTLRETLRMVGYDVVRKP